MWPIIRDLTTGADIECSRERDACAWYWVGGNGSCDCNRGHAVEEVTGLEIWPLVEQDYYCQGCHRFVIVGMRGDLEGWNEEDLIREANRSYPPPYGHGES